MIAPKDLVEYLQDLPKLKGTNINYIQYAILKHICENPDTTAYSLKKLQFPRRVGLHRKRKRTVNRKRDVSKYVDARSIRRCISGLETKGFIERSPRRVIERNSKPCRLTRGGVYYLILRTRILPYNIMKAIFENYHNDKLFELFLYPYIKKDTLRKIIDVLLVSRISLFLYQCCREIEDILVDNVTKKYVMELIQDRKSVHWNNDKKNTFRVVPAMSLEEFAADCLFLSMPQRVPTFIFDLISFAKSGSTDFRVLSQDKIFMQALRETRMNFDKQCELMMEGQRT
jgi:hypothetical protein